MSVDLINSPPHYISSAGIEPIDVIEQYNLGFHAGNAIKYLLRAGRKAGADGADDLRKARWYLRRLLERTHEPEGVRSPNAITEAFHLTGRRAEAVSAILIAALCHDRHELHRALANVEALLDAVPTDVAITAET